MWAGTQKIEKYNYNIEVHERFGPSLKTMFTRVKDPISETDLLHLLYQMVPIAHYPQIKLVEKYGSSGFVSRELDLDSIVFDPRPEKNELYLVNVFSLKKKGEECHPLKSKYCSRGSHLGLSTI